jgi:hypothetical protein
MIKNLFNRKETFGIVLILAFIFFLSYFNFLNSLMRSRDLQRRDDLTALAQALDKFYSDEDFGIYPPASADKKIVACIPEGTTYEQIKEVVGNRPKENKKKIFPLLTGCAWGDSSLTDPSDNTREQYLSVIPRDSKSSEGYSYIYFSTGKHFQVYGAYEGRGMPEYDAKIVARGLSCGNKICNFGKASRGTPLDISLEEFEEKLQGGM